MTVLPVSQAQKDAFIKMITVSLSFIKTAEQFQCFLKEDKEEFNKLGGC